MGDDLQIEAVVPILLFSLLVVKCFSSCSHSFFASIKTSEEGALKKKLYCLRLAVAVQCGVSPVPAEVRYVVVVVVVVVIINYHYSLH